jgi:hypothetical protein
LDDELDDGSDEDGEDDDEDAGELDDELDDGDDEDGEDDDEDAGGGGGVVPVEAALTTAWCADGSSMGWLELTSMTCECGAKAVALTGAAAGPVAAPGTKPSSPVVVLVRFAAPLLRCVPVPIHVADAHGAQALLDRLQSSHNPTGAPGRQAGR